MSAERQDVGAAIAELEPVRKQQVCWECGRLPQEQVPLIRCHQCRRYLLCSRPEVAVGSEIDCTLEMHLRMCTKEMRKTRRLADHMFNRLVGKGLVPTESNYRTRVVNELAKDLLFRLKD